MGELGGSFQASSPFGSFPPRARPQSAPTQRSSQVEFREFSAQAVTASFTLRTPFGFGSFPLKAAERYCRRGRREPGKVDRTASRAPALQRPSSAPAIRNGCEKK